MIARREFPKPMWTPAGDEVTAFDKYAEFAFTALGYRHTRQPDATAPVEPSPWMNSTEAAAYLHKGRRFVLKEIRSGRLRAATIGGRREVLTRRDWCDHWVVDHTAPVTLPVRTRTPRSPNDNNHRTREVA